MVYTKPYLVKGGIFAVNRLHKKLRNALAVHYMKYFIKKAVSYVLRANHEARSIELITKLINVIEVNRGIEGIPLLTGLI